MWLLPLVSAIFVFGLGVFVFLENKKSELNTLFTLFCLSITIWLFGTSMMFLSKGDAEAIFWDRVIYIGVVFIPAFLYHFSIVFTKIKSQRKLLFCGYVLSFVFLILSRTDYFVKGLYRYKWGCHTIAQPLHHIFLVFFSVGMFMFFLNIYKYYRSTKSPVEQNQSKYAFLAFGILLTLGSPAYLPAYKIPIPPFVFLSGVFFVTILAYPILKYRLMDINIVFGKGIVYLSIVVLSAGIYLFLIFGINKLFSGLIKLEYIVPAIILSFPGMIISIFVSLRIKSATEELIFRNKFKYLKSLRNFSKELAFISREDEILEQTVKNISNTMGVPKVIVMLLNDILGDYEIRANVGLNEEVKKTIISGESLLVNWLAKNKTIFVRDEATKIISEEQAAEINKVLIPLGASLCVPLIIREELIGILTLSDKSSKEMFSSWDLDLLETLAKDLSLAISYKRIESHIRQSDKLISLGTLSAGIAHDIRNPLSSVKTFIQLLPEKYNDREFRDDFSKVVVQDVNRIEHIIESILTLAKYHPPVFRPVSITELLNETLLLLDNDIKKNSIKVIKEFNNNMFEIDGDREQLRQVFLNIFINDIEAMNSSKNKTLKIVTNVKNNFLGYSYIEKNSKYVIVEITDSGPGIDKKLLNRIFDPFFTTKYSGTGLGLAIAHQIVDEHKGFIEVNSELGKGTTFCISLPRTF